MVTNSVPPTFLGVFLLSGGAVPSPVNTRTPRLFPDPQARAPPLRVYQPLGQACLLSSVFIRSFPAFTEGIFRNATRAPVEGRPDQAGTCLPSGASGPQPRVEVLGSEVTRLGSSPLPAVSSFTQVEHSWVVSSDFINFRGPLPSPLISFIFLL